MAIANVALTNTFDEWRTRTNQLIVQSNSYEISIPDLSNKLNNTPTYAYANNIGVAANTYANSIVTGANNYLIALITSSDAALGNAANAYARSTANGANAYMITVLNGANTAVGAGANAFAAATIAGANAAVGAAANAYSAAVGAAANTNAANGTYISTGAVKLAYGGTNAALTASAGALAYSTSSNLALTAVGTSGQILISAGSGAPIWSAQTALTVGNSSYLGGVAAASYARKDINESFAGTLTTASHHYITTTGGNERQIMFQMTDRNLYFYAQDTGKALGIWDSNAGNYRWYTDSSANFYVRQDIVAFASDERLKTDIVNIENALDKVNQIRGVHYRHNDLAISEGFEDKNYVGVIAQEIEKVLPEVVVTAPFDVDKETGQSRTGNNYKTVKYDKIVPLLIEAIKELNGKVESMRLEIEELKK